MKEFENDIKNCIAAFEKGGTILYPTDTIWGLGCDATDANAVDKISAIKNRPEKKSYIVLMSDVNMLQKYLVSPMPDLEAFIDEQVGATTIIYEEVKGIAQNALAADISLGIRIPNDDFCIELLQRFGKPIISTSANLSGEANPSFYKEMSKIILERTDYVCNWRQEDEEPKAPSSIIKINTDGSILKIR